MSIWEGLFRVRPSEGPSPETPHPFSDSSIANTCNSRASTAGQQQHQGAWQQPAEDSSSIAPDDAAGQLRMGSVNSAPVCIPETRILPYSRLRGRSASSPSPSPSRTLLSYSGLDSPGPESILPSTEQGFGGNGTVVQGQPNTRPRTPRAASSTGAANSATPAVASDPGYVTPKRPPLPPSPRSHGAQQQQGFVTTTAVQGNSSSAAAAAAAALLGGCYGSSRSPQQERVLGCGSLSGASSPRATSRSSRPHQQQQMQYLVKSMSLSPSREGLLASSLSAAETAAASEAAGNPHHPQHQQTMQMLLQHQQQQLLQLQAIRTRNSAAASAGSGSPAAAGVLQLPQSPRAYMRRCSSFSRLSELGTSPGLIEASFMGLAARPDPQLHRSSSSRSLTSGSLTSSRSATLQQLQQQQHAVLRQQQQQHLSRGPKSSASLSEWDKEASDGAEATAAAAVPAQEYDDVARTLTFDSSSTASSGGMLINTLAVPGQLLSAGTTPGSTSRDAPSGTAGSTVLFPGQQGGMKVLPGTQGIHWVSRADERESAARGLLGLPRPGFRNERQQQGLLLRSPSPTSTTNYPAAVEVDRANQGVPAAQQQGQRPQETELGGSSFAGFGHSSGDGLPQSSADAAALQATPVKIGQGITSAGDGIGNDRQAVPASGAAWIADSCNNQRQLPGSFKRAAVALAAARDLETAGSSTSAAGCAAVARSNGSNPSTPRSATALPAAEVLRSQGSIPSSPPAGSTTAASGNGSPLLTRSVSRRSISGNLSRTGSGIGFGRSPSSAGYPTCLICLDQLTPEDFESGEAMQLDCSCKGEVALRHRSCAEKWSQIKGNTICDVCKCPILNLPDVPPLPAPGHGLNDGGLLGPGGDIWSIDEPPAAADYVFDCIRVTWVVLIVCILFFELSVSRSFVTGILLGSVYVALAASWSAAQQRRRQHVAAAAATLWGAGQNNQQQEQRMPLLQAQIGGLEGLPV